MPKISVLMPMRTNDYGKYEEKFLYEAIQSVLNQTFKDFELIIVNDASTKESLEIVKKFQDPRIKLVHNPRQLGLTATLNKWFPTCSAEFIARQDADDKSFPNRFQEQYEVISQSPKMGAIGSYYDYIDTEGKIIVRRAGKDPHLSRTEGLAGNIPSGGAILRKEAIKQVGGWKYYYSQDFYMWVALRKAGWEIGFIPKTLYQYRRHDGQISVKYKKEQLAFWEKIYNEAIGN